MMLQRYSEWYRYDDGIRYQRSDGADGIAEIIIVTTVDACSHMHSTVDPYVKRHRGDLIHLGN